VQLLICINRSAQVICASIIAHIMLRPMLARSLRHLGCPLLLLLLPGCCPLLALLPLLLFLGLLRSHQVPDGALPLLLLLLLLLLSASATAALHLLGGCPYSQAPNRSSSSSSITDSRLMLHCCILSINLLLQLLPALQHVRSCCCCCCCSRAWRLAQKLQPSAAHCCSLLQLAQHQ
jgi:hypothetical protein